MSNLYDFIPDKDAVAYNNLALVDQYTLHLLSEFVSQVKYMLLLLFALTEVSIGCHFMTKC